jgi:putative membrane protein
MKAAQIDRYPREQGGSRVLRAIIVMWLILAVAIGVAAAIVPDVDISGGFFGVLAVAFVFALVNAIIGPLLRLLTLPLTVVTLGLFSLVVNGLLLAITAGLTDSLDVGGFLQTVLASIVIAAIASVLQFVLLRGDRS